MPFLLYLYLRYNIEMQVINNYLDPPDSYYGMHVKTRVSMKI